jgi:hypothetical protein
MSLFVLLILINLINGDILDLIMKQDLAALKMDEKITEDVDYQYQDGMVPYFS